MTYERRPTSKQDKFETDIAGYRIELDLAAGETTQCFISKGSYSASLACLVDHGVLAGPRGEHQVPGSVIGDIENWALQNGY